MLVLTRNFGKSVICIFDGIEIKVTVLPPNNPDSKQVKLGFEAPFDVEIVREELLERTRGKIK